MGRALRMPAVAALTLLTAVACGSGERSHEAESPKGEACEVSRETEPITARFPSFGTLRSTWWCGYALGAGNEARLSAPGPTDVRLVGLLEAADEKVVRAQLADPALHFEAATLPASLPTQIRALLPAGAEWQVSAPVDARISADSGTFYYDRRSGRVLFDCVNPRRKDSPSAAVPG